MRKSIIKEDRPDRKTHFAVSALISSLHKAFASPDGLGRRFRSEQSASSMSDGKHSAVKFETIEPRILMSGDPVVAVNASIDVPGETDQFGFTLTQNTRIVFDSLTNSANINWSLTGPNGTEVSNRNFSTSDAVDAAGSPLLDLATGDYTLTVDAVNDVTGSYGFRLIDVVKTPEVAFGEVVSGQLQNANESNVYRFSATTGERFFFDRQSLRGDVYWRLFDPNGKSVFGPSAMNDVGAITATADGSYTLLIEGRITATGSSSYSFSVQRFADVTSAMTLDTTVAGNIVYSGQRSIHTFTLDAEKKLYFDSLTNNANINWTLVGPQGTVASRNFTNADASSLGGSATYDLVAGDYQLIVTAPSGQTPSYSFRLLDVAQATGVTPGTSISGTLSPANETDAYRISAVAGDRYYFDYQSASGTVPAWRLIDPFGNLVFGPTGMNADIGILTLAYSGDYTLLVEGSVSSSGSSSYSFNALKVIDDMAPLLLGSTVSGNISQPGQRDFYTFTLDAAKRMHFDALTNNAALVWTLVGPQGTVASNQTFGSFLYGLVAGDYVLSVDLPADQTGAYGFRFTDIDQATAITPGTTISGQLNPANETDFYKFEANAGDQFLFDYLSHSGTAPLWRLLDPWGNEVFGLAAMNNGDIGPLTLNYAGTYTLLVEGALSSTGTSNYSFNVSPRGNVPVQVPSGTPLDLGITQAGIISVSGEKDYFTLRLAADTRIYFDSFTNSSNLRWSLAGPRGLTVSNRSLATSDSYDYGVGSSVLDLVAGDYVFTIDGTTGTTGSYSFRVMSLAQATELVPGAQVSAQLNPANETDLYRFDVSAGDRYYFDALGSSGGDIYWRLVNPYGKVVFDRTAFANDVGILTLDLAGTYTLLIEGRVGTSGTASYSFKVDPNGSVAVEAPTGTPFALNSTIAGTIDVAGEADRFILSLDHYCPVKS